MLKITIFVLFIFQIQKLTKIINFKEINKNFGRFQSEIEKIGGLVILNLKIECEMLLLYMSDFNAEIIRGKNYILYKIF